ncbi:MAG: response regulator [Deltaproteobacteria bacterium]|nr:response regulator [Deltaproteobacteria bacterium]
MVVLAGAAAGRRYVIDDAAVIGRDQAVAIVLDDPGVSRRHAAVRRADTGELELEDLESSNGTLVNGRHVRQARLERGDQIQVGGVVLQVAPYDPVEEDLRRRQRLETLGRLAAGITHELNNALAALLPSVDHLRALPGDRRLEAPEVDECLREVKEAGERAAEIVRRIGGFARGGSQRPVPIDLTELCEDAVRLARRTLSRSIEISSIIRPGLAVCGDAVELHQVLLNLFLNARDACGESGRIELTATRLGSPAASRAASVAPASWIVLSVKDDGQGMPPAVRQRIFEPFFTTKPAVRGTGLGLATVNDIVSLYQGRIEVESKPGRGSCFRVYLPAADPRARRLPTPVPLAMDDEITQPGLSPLRANVLLVDDEPAVQRSFKRTLEGAGCAVTVAGDGGEAVKAYRQASPRPDLVLLDLDLPTLPGAEVLRLLRRFDERVRVLIATGHVDEQGESELLKAGAVAVVRKPCAANELVAAVRAALRQPRSARSVTARRGPLE